MKERIMEADVLCVGGGIGGLMAAIRASELGAEVVVAEKANSLRSGAAAAGNDHFACYIPEVHGPDVEPVIEELRLGQMAGRLKNPEVAKVWFEKAFDMVKLWDSWGIPMKYQGRYEFAGHSFPGHRYPSLLKYAGQAQKPVLTREALKRGVKIVNRVMVFDLLGDDNITGALGVGTREDEVVEFKAGSIILGTGALRKLYPGPTPGWMPNLSFPGTISGDGRAMAYRAGAELVNMEMLARHAGPKYFARQGQGSWVGILRDPDGKPVGPFLSQPDRRYSDMTAEVNKSLFLDYAKAGRGPVYMDCRGISDEDYEYMMHWLKHEGNEALVRHLQEEGIDVRQNPVEFMTYEAYPAAVIRSNAKTETSVKGLYAIGDETLGGISAAATFGWIAGGHAAEYAKRAPSPDTAKVNVAIKQKKALLEDIRSRDAGPEWREVSVALQQIMNDYAGSIRSETLLKAGLSHLQRLKEKAYATVIARNQHELMRNLEVFNLLDLGELVFITAMERKETRGSHVRADYPFTNPLLDKQIAVKKSDNKPVIAWKPAGE